MCLAVNPEDRGTFLDLQRIVKGFQRQKDQPGSADHFQDLYEEAQEELEGLRSQLEADQMSLYQQDVEQKLKEEKEQLKMEKKQLIKQVKEKEGTFTEFVAKYEEIETQLKRDHAQVVKERNQTQSELQQQKNDWESLEKEYTKQIMSLDKLTKERDKLTGEAESLKQGLQKKVLEIDSLKQKFEDTEAHLTVKLSTAEGERDQAQLERELDKQERKKLLEDYTEKLKKLDSVTAEHQKLTLDHQRMQEKHTEEKKKLATEKARELAKKQDHIMQLEAAVMSGHNERTKLAAVQVTEREKLKTETDRMKKEHERSMTLLNKEKTEDRQKSDEERHSLQQEIGALKTDLSAYQKEAASAGHITNLKEVCRRQKKEIENKQEKLTAAEQSKSDVIKDLVQARAELSRLRGFCQGEIVKLKAQTVQGDTDLEQLLKENVELTESLTISQDQIPKTIHRELQNKFEALQTKSSRTERDLKAVKLDLQKQLNNSNWGKSKLENEKKALEQKVAGLEKGLACLKAAEGKLAALQIEHEKTAATLKSKEQELRNVEGDLEKASSDAKAKEPSFRRLQDINRSLELESNKAKDSLLRKEKELKSITYDLKLKERQLTEAVKRHSPSQTTKMDLGDRLESLELKLRLKEEEVTELRATIERNELAQKKLEDDVLKHEKLKSTHECLKGKHDNVEGHIKYLEEKSKKDHEECFSLARELKEAKDKVKEVESLSQQTKVANEKMAAELKEKVKLLEKALHQLEEESKTLEREHMCQLLRRDEEIGQLTTSSTSLKEVHRELQSKFESLKTKSGKTEDEVKAVEKQLQSTLQKAETLQKHLNSTTRAKSQLEIDRTSLLEKVKKLENEQVRLKAEESRLAALRVKHEGVLATIRAKEQELKKARDDVNTRDAITKAHQENIRHLQVEVYKSKNFIQAKEAELKKVKEELRFKERDQVIQTADIHQSLDHHFQKMTQSLGQMFRDSVAKDLSLLQSSQQKSLLLSSLPLAINTKSYASTAGQSTGSPSLLESVDPSLLQQALTLQKLMDYLPDLADKGLRIAGRLNMQKQWDSLASSHPQLCDRLQKLFAMWLEGEQGSETPHTWGFFISLVQEKGIDQHQLAKNICSNLNKTPGPNSASLSSSSLYLQ